MEASSSILNPQDPVAQMKVQVETLIISKMVKVLHLQLVSLKVGLEMTQLGRVCGKTGLVQKTQIVEQLLIVLGRLPCRQRWESLSHKCWWTLVHSRSLEDKKNYNLNYQR